FAAGTGCVHGSADERVAPDGQDDGVGAAVIGLGKDSFDYVFLAGVNGIREAEARGDGVALGEKIGSEHARADAPGERRMHEADGALPDDQDRIVRLQIKELY